MSDPSNLENEDGCQARLVADLKLRLAYLVENYRWSTKFFGCALSFNDSLRASRRSLNPRSRRKPERARVNPMFEVLVNYRARRLARARRANDPELTQADVDAAVREVTAEIKPRRGRPADELLIHHVQALMALYRQTCGKDLIASITRNSVYDPHFAVPLDQVLPALFRHIDPSVTATRIGNIVRKAHASNAIEGKRFEDFFPFFGGRNDPSTDAPSPGPDFQLESFEAVAPIYSS